MVFYPLNDPSSLNKLISNHLNAFLVNNYKIQLINHSPTLNHTKCQTNEFINKGNLLDGKIDSIMSLVGYRGLHTFDQDQEASHVCPVQQDVPRA